jgi:ectoine hydroxylase-related dioxygenase (phytanoyl-CoA dioxygenase family)
VIRDFNRCMEINAVSLVYYLSDVGENDHCLSVIPESHAARVDMKPQDIQPGEELDIHGPAGTAVFFHARCIHTGKLKPNSRQRRTIHIYFGDADAPRTSEWSQIPPRLHEKKDASLPPRLYAKWNSTRVIEGTGQKPRDVDPTMSAAEMIRVVQQRAKKC